MDQGMPAVDQAMAAGVTEPSTELQSFDPSIGGGASAPIEPVAPVEPVTPGSVPAPTGGGGARAAGRRTRVTAPASSGGPAAAADGSSRASRGGRSGRRGGSGSAPAPANPLNLDLRILSPGDNGAKGQQPVTAPGLNGNTGASPGVPEDWTWNWNWDLGGCDGGTGTSTAGWTWNWNWGCGDGGEPNVLEFVTESFPDAPMDLFSAAGVLDARRGRRLRRSAGRARGLERRDSVGRRTVGHRVAGAGRCVRGSLRPVAAAQPPVAAVLNPSAQDIQRAADRPRSESPASGADRSRRDPFLFPAPLAANSAGGTSGGGGGGAAAVGRRPRGCPRSDPAPAGRPRGGLAPKTSLTAQLVEARAAGASAGANPNAIAGRAPGGASQTEER